MCVQDHLAIPVLYASSWLLTAFASDFPIFFASRVMDIILTDRYVVAIMKVCCQQGPCMHIVRLNQQQAVKLHLCSTYQLWQSMCMCEHLISYGSDRLLTNTQHARTDKSLGVACVSSTGYERRLREEVCSTIERACS